MADALDGAASDLKVGELVREESFSLWNSVQALEVMDPKMDTGYVAPGEAFDSGYNVGRLLLPEEVLYVMDRIFCLEMTWLRGPALFQTLLTSNHIYFLVQPDGKAPDPPVFPTPAETAEGQPDPRWLNLCLLAFCVGTIIQCDMTIELVTSQQYFEEEDLNTQTYQVKLLSNVTDEQCMQLLDDAIQWLSIGDSEMTPVEEAILDRLELRRGTFIRSLLSAEVFNPDQCVRVASLLEESAQLGSPVSDAFNPTQYRKLSTLTPVREATEISLHEAVKDAQSTFESLNLQHHFVGALHVWRSPACLDTFLWTLADRHPRPSVISRSLLQYQLFGANGRFDRPEGVLDYMLGGLEELGFPDERLANGSFMLEDFAPRSVSMAIREAFEAWLNDHKSIFFSVLKALCMNHCRMRRCLINELASFGRLHSEPITNLADPVQYLQASLQSIVQIRRWQLATWIVQLGFEHDVYLPYELATQYAHLHNHLSAQLAILHKQHEHLTTSPVPAPFEQPDQRTFARHQASLAARIELTHATAQAARAFQLVYAVLLRAQLLDPPPAATLTTPALRHELRSREYAARRSDMPSHAAFDADAMLLSTPDAQLPTLLDTADAALLAVRTTLTEAVRDTDPARLHALGRTGELGVPWRASALQLLRATVEMKLRVAAVKSALAASAAGGAGPRRGAVVVVPPPERRAHPWWIVPELGAAQG